MVRSVLLTFPTLPIWSLPKEALKEIISSLPLLTLLRPWSLLPEVLLALWLKQLGLVLLFLISLPRVLARVLYVVPVVLYRVLALLACLRIQTVLTRLVMPPVVNLLVLLLEILSSVVDFVASEVAASSVVLL